MTENEFQQSTKNLLRLAQSLSEQAGLSNAEIIESFSAALVAMLTADVGNTGAAGYLRTIADSLDDETSNSDQVH